MNTRVGGVGLGSGLRGKELQHSAEVSNSSSSSLYRVTPTHPGSQHGGGTGPLCRVQHSRCVYQVGSPSSMRLLPALPPLALWPC